MYRYSLSPEVAQNCSEKNKGCLFGLGALTKGVGRVPEAIREMSCSTSCLIKVCLKNSSLVGEALKRDWT